MFSIYGCFDILYQGKQKITSLDTIAFLTADTDKKLQKAQHHKT